MGVICKIFGTYLAPLVFIQNRKKQGLTFVDFSSLSGGATFLPAAGKIIKFIKIVEKK